MNNLCWILILLVVLAGCSSSNTTVSTTDVESPCNSSTGLRDPLPACSEETPCTRVAPEVGMQTIDSPDVVPDCDPVVWDERFTQDVLGFTRYSCVRRPPGASVLSKRPLVLWFHPGGAGGADLASAETHLYEKSDSYDLTGDPARLGFILVSIQGRNLHFPTTAPRDGLHHDFYYRDLDSPSTNPDIANADAIIDAIVQEGIVDPSRIYVMGWSNGGFFAQLYAIARHDNATTEGNHVAACAVFAASNPFEDIRWDPFNEVAYSGSPTCSMTVPASAVPILIVYRTSDAAVACDAVQAACFSTEPGYTIEEWIDASAAAGLSVTGLMIGGLESGSAAPLDENTIECTDYSNGCPTGNCTVLPPTDACLSLVNHQRWPDGDYNNFPFDGMDRELDMLVFLRDNPL